MRRLRCNNLVLQAIKGLGSEDQPVRDSSTRVGLPHEALLGHLVGGSIIMVNLVVISLARSLELSWLLWPLGVWLGALAVHACIDLWRASSPRVTEGRTKERSWDW